MTCKSIGPAAYDAWCCGVAALVKWRAGRAAAVRPDPTRPRSRRARCCWSERTPARWPPSRRRLCFAFVYILLSFALFLLLLPPSDTYF